MVTFLTVLHLAVCIFLIIVVLLQAGKGGGMGIAFGGGGGSQTVFGSSGAGNFLTKLTSVTAFIFLVTSLGLAHYSSQQDSKRLQRLAERKADEKKVEDVRAAKLKAELEKARDAAGANATNATKKPSDAPNASEVPPGALKLGGTKPGDNAGGLKLTAPKLGADDAKAVPAAKTKAKVKADDAAGSAPATDGAETPKPKKKRRAAPPPEGTGAGATPAAPPEAPAAP
jgi:preprotein translocase subunit SecG